MTQVARLTKQLEQTADIATELRKQYDQQTAQYDQFIKKTVFYLILINNKCNCISKLK